MHFGGVPLQNFNGLGVGDADTVVRRLEGLNPPSQPQVPIEIVALHLVSVQPITVTYSNGQQPDQWNVDVGLSQLVQSNGQMTVTRDSPEGGSFNSQLRVVSRFTFTRVNPADGQTQTLDGGVLPPQALNQLILTAANTPWRSGCILPALAVPGLNDSFCPGLTTTGQKVLTVRAGGVRQTRHLPRPAARHAGALQVLHGQGAEVQEADRQPDRPVRHPSGRGDQAARVLQSRAEEPGAVLEHGGPPAVL